MTIKEILTLAVEILREANIQEPIQKARILLAFTIKKSKEYLITHDTDEISSQVVEQYKEYVIRLKNNEPLQYITGQQEFMKMNFNVNNNVLIPRQDTEILVEEVLELCKNIENAEILDLCTGSGIIAISIYNNVSKANVYASDISKEALKIAKQNNKNLKTEVKFIESNLFENIKQKFNIIVSNPPYIKTKVIELLDKEVQKEPIIALDGGKDGLKFYREIINNAHKFLKPNGYLCLEIGYDQKQEVIDIIKQTNEYKDIYSKKDLAGNDRIVICKKEK